MNTPYNSEGTRELTQLQLHHRVRALGKAGAQRLGFGSSLSLKETLSHCLPPVHWLRGDVAAISPEGTAGMLREARKSYIKALQILTALLWEQGGGHGSSLTFSAGSLWD